MIKMIKNQTETTYMRCRIIVYIREENFSRSAMKWPMSGCDCEIAALRIRHQALFSLSESLFQSWKDGHLYAF
jgi:hypothetical protein